MYLNKKKIVQTKRTDEVLQLTNYYRIKPKIQHLKHS